MTTIEGLGWKASVNITPDLSNEWIHLEASVLGDSLEFALAGADWIMDHFGKGRTCMIRVPPEADTYRDFDSKKNIYKGYVRFSWENAPYHWYQPQPHPRVTIMGQP